MKESESLVVRLLEDDAIRYDTEWGWHACGDFADRDDFQNMLSVYAYAGTRMVGWSEFIVRNLRLVCNNVQVEQAWQRKGIATQMYRLAERESGLRTEPHSAQTPAGAAFWRSWQHRQGGQR